MMHIFLQWMTRFPYNRAAMRDTAVNSVTSVGAMFGVVVLILGASLLGAPWLDDAQAQSRKRIVFDEDVAERVEGYVHRPEVGYIITRQEQEDLETLQLKESFLPKIVKSVEKKPF
ncbi:MAG: hypothetical protein VX498_10185 [Myxococcota bacterium]|nr:hypothetical protein [Myxococcota bacterium]